MHRVRRGSIVPGRVAGEREGTPLSYTTEITALLTNQLERFRHLHRHQLAGHVANLEFWSGQVRNCVLAIDGYANRFKQLKAASKAHPTWTSDPNDPGGAFSTRRPLPVSDDELAAARTALVTTWRQFLARCCREQLLGFDAAKSASDAAGVSFLPEDLSC